MSDTMTELREFLTTKVAKQNLEFAADRELWKAEAERMTSGYDAAQSELAALREELAESGKADHLRQRISFLTTEIHNQAERLAAAEQRNAELVAEVARRDALLEELGCPFDQVSDLYQKPTESGASE